MRRLLFLSLLLLVAAQPLLAHAEMDVWGQPSQPGPSIWDQPSSVPQQFRPNGSAGYLGSDLPPGDYQPDEALRHLYGSETDRTAPSAPLDNGQYSSRANPYCTGPLCGRTTQ